MQDMIADQIEWLLTGNLQGLRLKHQLLLVAGCVADDDTPSDIQKQLEALCCRINRQEVFEALLAPLNARLSVKGEQSSPSVDINQLLQQIDTARTELNACEDADEAKILAWVMANARQKKLFRATGSRR